MEPDASMVAQSIDQLKHDWTDKYVVVDGARPELARFREVVGQVKTVNMSGRALVEFLDYHVNIGWYDIDLSFLKVVDKPEPKAKGEAKKPAKPAAKAPAAEAAAPAKAKAAAKPAAGGKPFGGGHPRRCPRWKSARQARRRRTRRGNRGSVTR